MTAPSPAPAIADMPRRSHRRWFWIVGFVLLVIATPFACQYRQEPAPDRGARERSTAAAGLDGARLARIGIGRGGGPGGARRAWRKGRRRAAGIGGRPGGALALI